MPSASYSASDSHPAVNRPSSLFLDHNHAMVAGSINRVAFDADGQTFLVTLAAQRLSGTLDHLPVFISDEMVSRHRLSLNLGSRLMVGGSLVSFTGDDGHMHLAVHADIASSVYTSGDNINRVSLTGEVFAPLKYNLTPLGRQLAQTILSVPFLLPNGRKRFARVPIMFWSRVADNARSLSMGEIISVRGRIQSRDYQKQSETFTTQEVSIYTFIPVERNLACNRGVI